MPFFLITIRSLAGEWGNRLNHSKYAKYVPENSTCIESCLKSIEHKEKAVEFLNPTTA